MCVCVLCVHVSERECVCVCVYDFSDVKGFHPSVLTF